MSSIHQTVEPISQIYCEYLKNAGLPYCHESTFNIILTNSQHMAEIQLESVYVNLHNIFINIKKINPILTQTSLLLTQTLLKTMAAFNLQIHSQHFQNTLQVINYFTTFSQQHAENTEKIASDSSNEFGKIMAKIARSASNLCKSFEAKVENSFHLHSHTNLDQQHTLYSAAYSAVLSAIAYAIIQEPIDTKLDIHLLFAILQKIAKILSIPDYIFSLCTSGLNLKPTKDNLHHKIIEIPIIIQFTFYLVEVIQESFIYLINLIQDTDESLLKNTFTEVQKIYPDERIYPAHSTHALQEKIQQGFKKTTHLAALNISYAKNKSEILFKHFTHLSLNNSVKDFSIIYVAINHLLNNIEQLYQITGILQSMKSASAAFEYAQKALDQIQNTLECAKKNSYFQETIVQIHKLSQSLRMHADQSIQEAYQTSLQGAQKNLEMITSQVDLNFSVLEEARKNALYAKTSADQAIYILCCMLFTYTENSLVANLHAQNAAISARKAASYYAHLTSKVLKKICFQTGIRILHMLDAKQLPPSDQMLIQNICHQFNIDLMLNPNQQHSTAHQQAIKKAWHKNMNAFSIAIEANSSADQALQESTCHTYHQAIQKSLIEIKTATEHLKKIQQNCEQAAFKQKQLFTEKKDAAWLEMKHMLLNADTITKTALENYQIWEETYKNTIKKMEPPEDFFTKNVINIADLAYSLALKNEKIISEIFQDFSNESQ